MHGVPTQLTGLSDFEGAHLVEVADLENIVTFRFAREASIVSLEIGVEGEWKLTDSLGQIVARGTPSITPGAVAPILLSKVVFTETRPPTSVALRFGSGHTLEIFDSSDRYESFSIPHRNVYI